MIDDELVDTLEVACKREGKYVKMMVVWWQWPAEAKMAGCGDDGRDLKEGR